MLWQLRKFKLEALFFFFGIDRDKQFLEPGAGGKPHIFSWRQKQLKVSPLKLFQQNRRQIKSTFGSSVSDDYRVAVGSAVGSGNKSDLDNQKQRASTKSSVSGEYRLAVDSAVGSGKKSDLDTQKQRASTKSSVSGDYRLAVGSAVGSGKKYNVDNQKQHASTKSSVSGDYRLAVGSAVGSGKKSNFDNQKQRASTKKQSTRKRQIEEKQDENDRCQLQKGGSIQKPRRKQKIESTKSG